ncbi:MAG: type II secretion system F family protein [Opitutales bacterium]|jgi:type IV pilus assembly protein PilC
MANTSAAAAPGRTSQGSRKRVSFWESQRLAKQKQYEKQARRKKIKLDQLTVFTQQLSSMLEAGLPLVSALEALQEQTEDPVFQVVIRNVKVDISGGTAFSEAVAKYPNAFPNLFVSMVEAGEASGGLASILGKVAIYFEDTVKLIKQVKSAMTYPIAVIALAVGLVQVLLIFVIPVFAEMFSSFGKELPKPTQLLISTSNFLKSYIIFIIAGAVAFWYVMKRILKTPGGRRAKDVVMLKIPVVGALIQKIALSRFCRTYAILLRSGVPILRTLEIVSNASGNTFIELACKDISRNISQGGQLSETIAEIPYFPPTVKHMARAGEQTGNVDGMMGKIADFYDAEIETTVDALTSLMEPMLIVFLGVVIGGIVMAMFLPIFNLAGVVGG